jgi:gamma-glutamylcyclotransferase (GGCT)/AIG2-like uncharacterized protein YtfP
MSEPALYFAYGSNMHGPQMQRRVPAARAIGIGRLSNHRLGFTARSKVTGAVADVVEDMGEEVWGVLYEMSPADLDTLDRFETLYRRCEVVIDCGGSPTTAWLYRVMEPDLRAALSPRTAYLEKIVGGAIAAQLPAEYIARLQAIVAADD